MDWDIDIVNNTDEDLRLYESLFCDAFLGTVAGYNFSGEVSILLVNDPEMQELNRTHRGKDATTDVLSFPQYTAPHLEGLGYVALGDIVISIDKARSQADEYGHSLERELAFLTIHAALHLLGHDHDNEASEKTMLDLQNEILQKMRLGRHE